MAPTRDDSEQARLDRIERHIRRLAEASAALQQELIISRRLAAERARSARPHESAIPKSRGKKKKR
jgi:hypothetical protein